MKKIMGGKGEDGGDKKEKEAEGSSILSFGDGDQKKEAGGGGFQDLFSGKNESPSVEGSGGGSEGQSGGGTYNTDHHIHMLSDIVLYCTLLFRMTLKVQ